MWSCHFVDVTLPIETISLCYHYIWLGGGYLEVHQCGLNHAVFMVFICLVSSKDDLIDDLCKLSTEDV